MNICIVSEDYPAANHPYFTFVENLCKAIVKNGHKVYVIAPQSLSKILIRGEEKLPYCSKEDGVTVYRPLFFTVGNVSIPLNYKLFSNAVYRTFKQISNRVDACYGHFWHSAYCLFPAARKFNKPLFVASGECEIELHQNVNIEKLRDFCNYVSGVICVSTKNKEESVGAGLTTPDKCIIVPNSIDNTLFTQLERESCRAKYGLSGTDFVVAFVGGFVQRKGPGRVAKAIKTTGDNDIKSIFVGYYTNGVIEDPVCDGIVFKGSLAHDEVPLALNAADVFVMPTLQEGCCNANIEAMACGLPVISSDLPFNYDVLNPTNSILIDPENIEQIASAIKKLKEDINLRKKLKEGAIKMAKTLTIQNRAKIIANFIESKI